MYMTTLVKQIRHPYIITDKKIRGGEPVISGTGIRILDIAVRYEIMGMSPEDIIVALPHLNLSQVHDALSYYYENKNQIDKTWKDAIKNVEAIKKSTRPFWRKRLAKLKIYTDENVDIKDC